MGRGTVTGTIRRLVAFIEPGQRLAWVGVAVLALVVTGLEVLAALLIFVVVQLVVNTGGGLNLPILGNPRALLPNLSDRQVLVVAMAIVAAFFLVRAAVVLVQSYLQARLAERTALRISAHLFRGYLRMPYTFHLQRNSAELMRNVNEAVKDVVDYTLMPALRIAAEALLIIGLGLVLVLTAPLSTALAAALFLPLMALLFRVVQPRIAALGKTAHELNRSAIAVLQQSLHGFRDISILGREEYFADHYERTRAEIARTRYLRTFLGDVPRIVLETGLILFVALLVGGAVALGGAARQSLAVLGMFAYAAVRILPSLSRIVLRVNDLRFGAAAAIDVHHGLVAVESAPQRSPSAEEQEGPPLPMERAIRLDRVTYGYPGTEQDALAEVSVEIARGEMLGVVGPTGGGKSTLMDVILGLLPPASGRVLADDVEINTDLQAWQRSLGVVPQAVYLLDTTLRRNIALGLDDGSIDEERVREAVRLSQLESFVASLPKGLDTPVGERGSRVSGGERQRVAIARALYRRPTILVFDEATSALDLVTEAELLSALEPLRGGRTVIIVAHRLSTVRHCDRILLVDAGRIVDAGSFDDLVERNAAFRRLATAVIPAGTSDASWAS